MPFGDGWKLPSAMEHHVAAAAGKAHREQTAAMLRAREARRACTHPWAPQPAAAPTLLPTVVPQRRLPRDTFAGGSRLPRLPLTVLLSVKEVLKTDLLINFP